MPIENERSRRDQQLADVMFGTPAEPAKTPQIKPIEGETFTQHEQRLAETLHPAENTRFPDRIGPAEEGRVKDIVRDRDGDVITQSNYGGQVGSNEKLAASHGLLSNADLSGMDFRAAGASLAHTDLRGADLRGAKLLDVGHANLTGALVDQNTDLTGVNFAGSDVGPDLYQKLRGCKGFDKALNLNKPRVVR